MMVKKCVIFRHEKASRRCPVGICDIIKVIKDSFRIPEKKKMRVMGVSLNSGMKHRLVTHENRLTYHEDKAR